VWLRTGAEEIWDKRLPRIAVGSIIWAESSIETFRNMGRDDLIEKIDFVLDIVRAADRPILKIFKGVKLYGLYIDFIIANEDAYKCALNYGRISGALYNVLAWLSVLFSVKLKTIDINPGFAVDKPRWDAAGKIKFRPITAVVAGVGLLLTYLFKFLIPGMLQDRKLRKQATRQK
ncbi:MAG: hypothetical protein J6U16_07910, partial [Ruminococcus sp.]|nr:hypothetical protein [Ruminococcus sp.]